ncbi:hypothetical protein AVEN_222040-1 [Araneus ventricosus]|uniref:Uncharacterized protein n=1 Tax=Araneus ventricosus TaxID=182803 RepID=A0A4Y2UTK6_ARAVE|nr:hypothetical protein AVEN_222040-1 [Araneus ventricosus]
MIFKRFTLKNLTAGVVGGRIQLYATSCPFTTPFFNLRKPDSTTCLQTEGSWYSKTDCCQSYFKSVSHISESTAAAVSGQYKSTPFTPLPAAHSLLQQTPPTSSQF